MISCGLLLMCLCSCEDSLLATPLIIDLALLAEIMTRIEYRIIKPNGEASGEFESMYSILSLLSICLKAPLVKPGTPVVNGWSKQLSALRNFLLAVQGLPPINEMALDSKLTW